MRATKELNRSSLPSMSVYVKWSLSRFNLKRLLINFMLSQCTTSPLSLRSKIRIRSFSERRNYSQVLSRNMIKQEYWLSKPDLSYKCKRKSQKLIKIWVATMSVNQLLRKWHLIFQSKETSKKLNLSVGHILRRWSAHQFSLLLKKGIKLSTRISFFKQ